MKFLGPPSSGSIAGTTSSHNRAGQYTRNRRSPVQPVGTGRRAFIRSSFGTASKAWSDLSGADQSAWSAYADGYPVTDSLGQAIKLTGHQMFVSINTQALNVGQTLPAVIPGTRSVTLPGITAFTFVRTGTPALTLTLDGLGSSSDFILVAFARPVSGGVSFIKTFWQCMVAAGNVTTVAGLLAKYSAQFGLPAVGQRVFVKLTPVNSWAVTGIPITRFATVT